MRLKATREYEHEQACFVKKIHFVRTELITGFHVGKALFPLSCSMTFLQSL